MKKITLCISCVLLSGCFGDNDVQKLKEVVFPEVNNSVNLGSGLDGRSICSSTNWAAQKKDTNIIDYTCELTEYREMFNTFQAQQYKKETADLNKALAASKAHIEKIDLGLESLEKIKALMVELKSNDLIGKYQEKAKALGIEPNYEFITNDDKKYVFRYNRKKDLQNEYIQLQKDIKEVVDTYELEENIAAGIPIFFSSKEKSDELTQYLYSNLKDAQNEGLDRIKELKAKKKVIGDELVKATEAIAPKKIVQFVTFHKAKDKFTYQSCEFKLTLNDNREIVLNSGSCFPMSYEKGYTDDYRAMFGKYYGESLDDFRKLQETAAAQSADATTPALTIAPPIKETTEEVKETKPLVKESTTPPSKP